MEVFQKLKAKLAEGEADSESDREQQQQQQHSSGSVRRREGGDNGDRAEALEAEVMELKEHINKNYFVYVRRLEKRKERIKELEEYAKLLIKDNEALQEKQRELEGMLKGIVLSMSFSNCLIKIGNLMSLNCWLSRLSEAAVRVPRERGAAGGVPEPGAGQGQAHAAERGDGPRPGEEEEEGAGGVVPREVRRGRCGRT